MNGIKLIVFIIERGRSNMLIRLCHEKKIAFNVVLHGRGTASREVLSILGIGDTEKDVVLLSVDSSRADAVLDELSERMKLDRPGGGIAFSIPFSAAASQLHSIELFAGNFSEEPEKRKRSIGKRDRRPALNFMDPAAQSIEISQERTPSNKGEE